MTKKEIYNAIGWFYFIKNKKDFEETRKEIERLQITDVIIYKDNIEIVLGRPGLLMGLRGYNIDNLYVYLKEEFELKKLHISITENTDISNLFNYEYVSY
ncbi:MAG: hypothetical protein ACOC1K_05660 [Nanoarchaeota archaeon]